MRSIGWIIVAALVCLPASAGGEDAGVGRIQWAELDQAWQAAKKEDRPLFLYITMDGCTYCRMMENSTYVNPEVATALNTHFLPTKVNRSERPDLVDKLGVKTYPTTVIISSQREVLAVMTGYVDAEQLKARLESVRVQRLASRK